MSQTMWIVTNFPGDFMNIAGVFSSRMKAEQFVRTHITGYCEIFFKHVDPTDNELFNGFFKSDRIQIEDCEDFPLRFNNGRQLKIGDISPYHRRS